MSNVFLTRLAAIMLLIVAILFYFWVTAVSDGNAKENRLTNLLNAVTDTLRTVKLSDNTQKATINSLTVEKTKDLLSIKTKDSSIIALQTVVKQYEKQLKNGGSVIVVKGDTKIIDSTKTIVVKDSSGRCPKYMAKVTSSWYTANLRMKCDSSFFDIKITNDYTVVVGKAKDGKWFADVTNRNPYSAVRIMRVTNIDPPKQKIKRVNLCLFGGYGFNLKGTVQAAPLIGVGISYTIVPLF